jgi:RNA polymerase sigma-70 factor (ECF subfamily)
MFSSIVDNYYNKIFKYCKAKYDLDNYNTEDCVQDIFMTLYRNMDRLNHFEKIGPWLYRTSDNYAKKYVARLSKDIKRFKHFDENYSEDDENLEYSINFDLLDDQSTDIDKYMRIVFSKLSEVEIATWSLYFKDGCSIRELAETLKISENAVKSRVSRLKLKIKVIVKDLFPIDMYTGNKYKCR